MPGWVYRRCWKLFRTVQVLPVRIRYAALPTILYNNSRALSDLQSLGSPSKKVTRSSVWLGFIIRRKQGKAVHRNRFKRVLRHRFTEWQSRWPVLMDTACIIELTPGTHLESVAETELVLAAEQAIATLVQRLQKQQAEKLQAQRQQTLTHSVRTGQADA